MDWKATWMGQHRWFATEKAAAAWAAEEVRQWIAAGGGAPLYRVIYNPTGRITQTYGGI